MSNIKDMPAFPCGRDVTLDQYAPSSGITIRDYFAGLALSDSYGQLDRFDQFKQCAKAAYEMADAMLEARELKPLLNIEMALRVAEEYGTTDSQIDSGNLYAALRQCLDYIVKNERR